MSADGVSADHPQPAGARPGPVADEPGPGTRLARPERRQTPRGGRDAVVERVLDAGEELFSQRAYADVTVRQLADAAGVSHALVHRYFGSKLDVLTAVLKRNEGGLTAVAAEMRTVQEAATAMLDPRYMEHTKLYFALVVRAALDGVLPEAAPGGFPATELLAALARTQAARAGGAPPAVEPGLAVAAVVSMMLGFTALRGIMLGVVGLQHMDAGDVDEQLRRAVLALLDGTVPPG